MEAFVGWRVNVITNGCNECRLEAAEVEALLKEDPSYAYCRDFREADLVVFLTCSFSQNKEDLSLRILAELDRRKKSGAEVLPLGCLVRLKPELCRSSLRHQKLVDRIEGLSRFETCLSPSVNIPYREFWDVASDIFGNSSVKELLATYFRKNPLSVLTGNNGYITAFAVRLMAGYRRLLSRELAFSASKTFCVRISTGCRGRCTFCSIRISRGDVRSKPISAVVEEVQRGLSQGYDDIALLGTDVGDYGKERGDNLVDLLRVLVSLNEKFSLRLRNVNPRCLIASAAEFCGILKSGKIAYALFPVESGSDRVLEAMGRGYRVRDYLDAVRKIREADPKFFIATQIMVGFPGETEEDFRQSVKLLDRRFFDHVEVYRYTPRHGTKIAASADIAPEEAVLRRYRELEIRAAYANSMGFAGRLMGWR
jgi:tRNA A37 methylthiotransferase MiaB